MIRRGTVGWEVELHKRTLEQALLSLVGPQAARGRGRRAVGPEHANRARAARGRRRAARRHRPRRRRRLRRRRTPSACAAPSTSPAVPEAAAEVLRVESGRPRYGLDLDDATIPQEAGLNERAVSFTKGCYVGQETVARLHYTRQAEPPPARAAAVGAGRDGRRRCASASARSGGSARACVSPRLGPIALALVRREAAAGRRARRGLGGRARSPSCRSAA